MEFISRASNPPPPPSQGIDIKSGGRYIGHKNRTAPKSENVYINLLHKLYSFLARRTDASFNGIVSKRLTASRVNRPPMGLARVARYMKGKEDKIAVIVGTVTDDIRLDGATLPAMKIAALRFTEGARARLVKAGGEVLTFDQLALLRPRGENTVLLRGRKNARTATRYFGAPGVPNSTTRPRVRSKGRKVCAVFAETARVGLPAGSHAQCVWLRAEGGSVWVQVVVVGATILATVRGNRP